MPNLPLSLPLTQQEVTDLADAALGRVEFALRSAVDRIAEFRDDLTSAGKAQEQAVILSQVITMLTCDIFPTARLDLVAKAQALILIQAAKSEG